MEKGSIYNKVSRWISAGKFLEFKHRLRSALVIYFELGVIILWSFWVCHGILNFDPDSYLGGHEYPMVTQYHYIWENLGKCGPCIFWNGSINGGAPAFAELQGAVLHPYVIITTLIWGVINGGKVVFLISLITAGFGVWKMTKTLGMRMPVRLWAACMTVVAGNLTGKIENGGIELVLASAWATVTIAALVDLILSKKRLYAVWLGVSLAMTLLSGQGYIQISLIFVLVPAILLFMLHDFRNPNSLGRKFVLSLEIAILLTAVLWVPLLHFLPVATKAFDADLTYAQPLKYEVFSLLVNDFDYYRIQVLGQGTAPYIHINYIGWIPFLFGIISFFLVPKEKRRLSIFFYLSVFLVLFCPSFDGMHLLYKIAPIVAGIRYPSIMTSLAAPLLILMAAWSFNELLNLNWPRFGFYRGSEHFDPLPYQWIIIVPLMLMSIVPAYKFCMDYIGGMEKREVSQNVIAAVTTPSTEWVKVPFDEYTWIPNLLNKGMKISETYRPWHWIDRDMPLSYYEVTRNQDAATDPDFVEEIDDLYILKHPNNYYAYIASTSNPDEKFPCQAASIGGNIDVVCDQNSPAGTLVVQENRWSGWKVTVNGVKQTLLRTNWLETTAKPGKHTYSFRYRPLDVYIGIFFSLAGWIAVVYLLARKEQKVLVAIPIKDAEEGTSTLGNLPQNI